MDTKRYVLGFAYSVDKSRVLLVQKLRPEWQRGLLNGIGGKIEPNEFPEEAMYRECMEETGLHLQWRYGGKMSGINNDGSPFECYIYYAFGDIYAYEQKEDELLGIFTVSSLAKCKIIDNLNWLVPFGIRVDGCASMRLFYK